jgi:hopanoid biosynthesis associated radical SAM protein HpnH
VLLREQIDSFRPSKFLTFSFHVDGSQDMHDFAVCREGVYHEAVLAIREAVTRGFRVTTNTTLFEGADPNAVRAFFDDMMDLGVEGLMISPGYAYEKAPDQDHFLPRKEITRLFRMILSNRDQGRTRWRWNQSPLFLEFLMGRVHFDCTPWGNPTYNVFGWQRPCYLLQDGYVDSYEELIAETDWSKYGGSSGNAKCSNCMVHCGHEPSAVNATFSSAGAFWRTILATFGRSYRDRGALVELANERHKPDGPLVQIELDQELAERKAREVA